MRVPHLILRAPTKDRTQLLLLQQLQPQPHLLAAAWQATIRFWQHGPLVTLVDSFLLGVMAKITRHLKTPKHENCTRIAESHDQGWKPLRNVV